MKCTIRNDGEYPRGIIEHTGRVVHVDPGQTVSVHLHDGTYRSIKAGKSSPFVIVDCEELGSEDDTATGAQSADDTSTPQDTDGSEDSGSSQADQPRQQQRQRRR